MIYDNANFTIVGEGIYYILSLPLFLNLGILLKLNNHDNFECCGLFTNQTTYANQRAKLKTLKHTKAL